MAEEKLAQPDQENNIQEEEFNFDWPEDRFQELTEGQVIEAKVIMVRDDAAFVDIGGKSDLIIPLEELTSAPAVSAKDVVKTGDVVKVMVTRTGAEDKILLSKRLVDQEQKWWQLAEAFQEGRTVSGTVNEVVKSGLSVNINGVKAFMPASQSGAANLESLIGKIVPLKILEFDQSKKRVLVSYRAVLEAEKKKAEAEFYSTIQEGERRRGVVTRITDFGAFVDLGSGIEGLIHVSELSWNRVKSPREVLKEGDQVEVIITKVDQAKKRLSLSLKQLQTHPWLEAAVKFKEGAVYPGTVVRMEPFGAFIRLAPGVDGLAHISQISDKRIAKPDEVLSIGQEVQAKILKIDTANRRISLSLSEAVQDQNKQELDQFINAQGDGGITQNLGDFFKK